jgi:hypothetical protein
MAVSSVGETEVAGACQASRVGRDNSNVVFVINYIVENEVLDGALI